MFTIEEEKLLKDAMLKLRCLNNKTMKGIISIIAKKDKITVTGISEKVDMSQSLLSQYLMKLRSSGFVVSNREGYFVYYSVDKEKIQEFLKSIKKLIA